jgi:hypothetical protein
MVASLGCRDTIKGDGGIPNRQADGGHAAAGEPGGAGRLGAT